VNVEDQQSRLIYGSGANEVFSVYEEARGMEDGDIMIACRKRNMGSSPPRAGMAYDELLFGFLKKEWVQCVQFFIYHC